MKKFLILENDIEQQGLPDFLQDVLDINKEIPYKVWWWFGEDVRQNPEKSFERFSNIDSDTFILTNPSFVGYGNSFEGKLNLFCKLMELGIKIRIGVIYYPDFYWFLVKWLHDRGCYVGSQKEKDKEIAKLKACLDYHEIYSIKFDTILNDVPIKEAIKRLTWGWLSELYFKDKSTVYHKGVKREVGYVHINENNPEKSEIKLVKKLSKTSYTHEGVLISEIKRKL